MFSNIWNGITSGLSSVYNTVSNALGFGGQTANASQAMQFPVASGTQLNPPAPTPTSTVNGITYYNGYSPTIQNQGTAIINGVSQPVRYDSSIQVTPASGGMPSTFTPSANTSTQSYSSSGQSGANFNYPSAPASLTSGSLTGGTSPITPSSPSSAYSAPRSYAGTAIVGNIATGADPTTGLYPGTTPALNADGTINTTNTAGQKTDTQRAQDYVQSLLAPPSETDAYNKAVAQTGLLTAQQQKNNTQNQINGITAKMNSDILQLRGTAEQNGVTEAVYGGQQAEVTREATIQLLPLQAQLAVDQGNLQLATDNTNTLFKIYADDAKNAVDQYNDGVKAIYDAGTADEKKQADDLLWQKNFNADQVKSASTAQATVANEFIKSGNMEAYKAITSIPTPSNVNSPTFAEDFKAYQQDVSSAVAYYGGSTASENVSIQDGNGNNISVPTSVAPYVATSYNGVNYVDASTLQGTAAEKKQIVDQAQAAGLKVILNKNSVLDLTNIKDANNKLDTATTLLNDITQPDALARDLGGYGLTQLGVLAQTNPKAAIAQSLPIIGLDILKAISGVQGFRGNQSAIQQIQDHLPKPTDTATVAEGKVEFIRKLLTDREVAIVGENPNPPSAVTGTSEDFRAKYGY